MTAPRSSRRVPNRQTLKTWSFDSAGDKKYALQIQRAANGNPCLRIVQGTPQADGSYRKFDITIWSEDFATLFDKLEEVSAYIEEYKIRTPPDHVYRPKPRAEPDSA